MNVGKPRSPATTSNPLGHSAACRASISCSRARIGRDFLGGREYAGRLRAGRCVRLFRRLCGYAQSTGPRQADSDCVCGRCRVARQRRRAHDVLEGRVEGIQTPHELHRRRQIQRLRGGRRPATLPGSASRSTAQSPCLLPRSHLAHRPPVLLSIYHPCRCLSRPPTLLVKLVGTLAQCRSGVRYGVARVAAGRSPWEALTIQLSEPRSPPTAVVTEPGCVVDGRLGTESSALARIA